jgi:hypothetical protein
VNVDASVTTALATLLGAAIGGLTSVLATLLAQRTQARAQWFEQEARRRRDLYKEFIETAARCYVHALQNEEADIPSLVDLYAKIDRMRILSSAKVVDIAQRFAQKIVDHSGRTDDDKTYLVWRRGVHDKGTFCNVTQSAAPRVPHDRPC